MNPPNNTFTWSINSHSPSSSGHSDSDNEPTYSDSQLFQMLLGEEANKVMATKQNNQPSTGKLDFRSSYEFIPDSQLKSMSTKERRQLRNKISARNFRNRRKEYVDTLEMQLQQQVAENEKLKLELEWTRKKMEELQTDNDKLRIELIIGGMSANQENPLPQYPTVFNSSDECSPPSSIIPSFSSDESRGDSPQTVDDFNDMWDFVLPNTYLSHATIPTWDIGQLIKSKKEPSLMVDQFPLLTLALMSIVIAHTMQISAEQLAQTATDKQTRQVWDMLEPLVYMKQRNSRLLLEEKKEEKEEAVEDKKGCAITRYLSGLMASRCPPAEENAMKHLFCRQLFRAKQLINPC
ncbi:hypothetical protein BDB01DRAFT_853274 [Pilobolus umbonatus]|nr:hypothetical protein BDB01DRAFT_853274 [Pilobolus umbonatus]